MTQTMPPHRVGDDTELERRLVDIAPHDYDCITGNIATYLALHDMNPDSVLGSVFTLTPDSSIPAAPTFTSIGTHQIEAASTRSGLSCTEHAGESDTGDPIVAVGDGYDMPWSPYFEKHHIEHGFLVLPNRLAFDPYRTITEFGEASPRVVEDADLQSVPVHRHLALALTPTDNRGHAEPSVKYDACAVDDYERAVESGAVTVEQLAIDTWLLSRARKVNRRYAVGARSAVVVELGTSVELWAKASESVYMALRRVRRGRSVPTSYIGAIAEALTFDRVLAQRWVG